MPALNTTIIKSAYMPENSAIQRFAIESGLTKFMIELNNPAFAIKCAALVMFIITIFVLQLQ